MHAPFQPLFGIRAHQIVPTASNGIDAVNFRQMNESTSLHLEKQHSSNTQFRGVAGTSAPGSPGLGADDGMEASPEVDLFNGFTSMTLHYDGEC